jgi:hypothetical protein
MARARSTDGHMNTRPSCVICKLPLTTLVFLPRYREARKLPSSPRWSRPSQGSPCKGQAPGHVTPWIALDLPHVQVGLRRAFQQASPGCSPPSSLSSFWPKHRETCSLWYTVAATSQAWLVWSYKTTNIEPDFDGLSDHCVRVRHFLWVTVKASHFLGAAQTHFHILGITFSFELHFGDPGLFEKLMKSSTALSWCHINLSRS